MKKVILLGIALLSGASIIFAQTPGRQAPEQKYTHAKSVFLGLQGGPVLNIYENAFSYRENGKAFRLVTPQAGGFLGYDFNDSYGIRLWGSYAKNAGACNVRQTSGGGFYPYTFKSVNAYLDVILNLCGLADMKDTQFRPKLYGGLGGAHTFGFTDAKHPWQKVTPVNNAFGFRLGFIAEYNFKSGFGVFADFCGEAYTDQYNGLRPSAEEQKAYEGYGGFPLDLRGLISFGIVMHFI